MWRRVLWSLPCATHHTVAGLSSVQTPHAMSFRLQGKVAVVFYVQISTVINLSRPRSALIGYKGETNAYRSTSYGIDLTVLLAVAKHNTCFSKETITHIIISKQTMNKSRLRHLRHFPVSPV